MYQSLISLKRERNKQKNKENWFYPDSKYFSKDFTEIRNLRNPYNLVQESNRNEDNQFKRESSRGRLRYRSTSRQIYQPMTELSPHLINDQGNGGEESINKSRIRQAYSSERVHFDL